MNFKQLESFVQVAELGSFSKAALVQGIAQPALSRQVRALEIALRETLLLRNGRGVVLTEAGQRLYEHGVNILQALAQAEISTGRVDLGLLYNPEAQTALEISPLIEEALCLVSPLRRGPEAAPAALGRSVLALRELPGLPLIVPERAVPGGVGPQAAQPADAPGHAPADRAGAQPAAGRGGAVAAGLSR